MLEFRQNDLSADLIVTLTENATLSSPNYLFVFTHVTTKDKVVFVKTEADDLSNYPDRYNQFTINPSAIFAGFQPGAWQYTVYEQADAINLDPALAGAPVEYGQLLLNRSIDFAFTKYDAPTTFKTYNG